jgi:hypothetical protein
MVEKSINVYAPLAGTWAALAPRIADPGNLVALVLSAKGASVR